MKFKLTPSATGTHCNANGKPFAISSAPHGIAYADEAAYAAALGLTPRPLYLAKQEALAALAREVGLPADVNGIAMRTDADTQAQMNNLVTLLGLVLDEQPNAPARAAVRAMMVSTITGPVLDAAGGEHDMSVGDVLGFTILYGQAVGAARRAGLVKKAAIMAAQSIEDLP